MDAGELVHLPLEGSVSPSSRQPRTAFRGGSGLFGMVGVWRTG